LPKPTEEIMAWIAALSPEGAVDEMKAQTAVPAAAPNTPT
jgi:hypothetical protein